MYRKEQEEYEMAMKSYIKEATNSSFIRDSPPPHISHSSPVPTEDASHSYSAMDRATDMALTSSQQGSSIIDEDEDLMEHEPIPRQYHTSNKDIDAETDELLDDDDSTDFQQYPSMFSSNSKLSEGQTWEENQKSSKEVSINEMTLAANTH
jgi:hypothetical protein